MYVLSHFVIATKMAVASRSAPQTTSASTAVTLCKALSKARLPSKSQITTSATITAAGAIIRHLFVVILALDHSEILLFMLALGINSSMVQYVSFYLSRRLPTLLFYLFHCVIRHSALRVRDTLLALISL